MTGPVVQCPSCHKPFRVPADSDGMLLMCPHCSTTVEIGDESSDRIPPPTPSAADAETAQPRVISCLQCEGRFKIAPSMADQWVACPHCQAAMQVDSRGRIAATDAEGFSSEVSSSEDEAIAEAPEIDLSAVPPPRPTRGRGPTPSGELSGAASGTQANEPSAGPEDSSSSTETDEAKPGLDPDLAKLLPPKFIVEGMSAMLPSVASESRVVLPDAAGGFRSVDTSVRTVRVGQQTVAIQSLSPAKRRRRRLIRSAITIVICTVLLLAVLRLLLG